MTLVAAIATSSIVRVIARSAVSVWQATEKPAPLASHLEEARGDGQLDARERERVDREAVDRRGEAARDAVGVDRELAVDRLEGDGAGEA